MDAMILNNFKNIIRRGILWILHNVLITYDAIIKKYRQIFILWSILLTDCRSLIYNEDELIYFTLKIKYLLSSGVIVWEEGGQHFQFNRLFGRFCERQHLVSEESNNLT